MGQKGQGGLSRGWTQGAGAGMNGVSEKVSHTLAMLTSASWCLPTADAAWHLDAAVHTCERDV